MRITHLSVGALPRVFSDGGGAVQRRVGELATAQVAAGHDVTVISPDVRSARAEHLGVRCLYVGCRARGQLMHVEFLVRARALIARAPRPDVIHVHNEPEGAAALTGTGAPVVLSFDNFYFRQRKGVVLRHVYRSLLLRYALLLPVSAYCRDESTRHWRLPPEQVAVLPNGVNLAQFACRPLDARAERERAGVGDDHVLLYVGRICRQKGVHVLLDAFARIRTGAERPVRLLLAGPIGQFDDRHRAAETAAWERRIAHAGGTYLGRIPEPRLAGVMSMASVFVMPTVALEMQGMAALEAQACGVPVVASDHGGLAETVPDGCGVRFATGDSGALAGAVLGLLREPGRRTALATAARAHAATYAWEEIAARATAVYRRAGAR